jgi:hypothetical protein
MLQESATTAWAIRTMYYTPSKEMDAACRPHSVALCGDHLVLVWRRKFPNQAH